MYFTNRTIGIKTNQYKIAMLKTRCSSSLKDKLSYVTYFKSAEKYQQADIQGLHITFIRT